MQKWNRLTEEIDIDFEAKESDKVIGYAGFFELINGFRKTVYWTKSEVEAHKKKFSKSDFGWKNDWDAMAKKTVIRNLLSKWGILSIELQTAYVEDTKDPSDRKEINDDSEYVDFEVSEVPNEPADEPPAETKKEAKQKGSAEDLALKFEE